MEYDRQATWQNPRVLGLLFLVLSAGAAAGAFGMSLVGNHTVVQGNPSVGLTPEKNKETMLQHMKKELDLTPEQAQRIDAILDDYLKFLQLLQDQIDDTRATGRQRVLNVLTPEQRIKFEKVTSGLEKRSK